MPNRAKQLRDKLGLTPGNLTPQELQELVSYPNWRYIGMEDNGFLCELCGKRRKRTHVFVYTDWQGDGVPPMTERYTQIDLGTECYKRIFKDNSQ